MCRLRESTIVFLYMYIIKEQQTEVINTKCYHDNLHACKGTRRVHFFMLLAGAPSLRKFPYSTNVHPTKRYSFSVTLVWSPILHSTNLQTLIAKIS